MGKQDVEHDCLHVMNIVSTHADLCESNSWAGMTDAQDMDDTLNETEDTIYMKDGKSMEIRFDDSNFQREYRGESTRELFTSAPR